MNVPHLRRRSTLVIALAVLAVAGVAFLVWPNNRPLPPLIVGAHSGGGQSACPFADGHPPSVGDVSPQLQVRLQEQFPSGTPVERLIKELKNQGFGDVLKCEHDPTIQWVGFYKAAGFSLHATTAFVYWKADASGSLVWTKGYVFFVGL